MRPLDELITRSFFRLEELQVKRLWMERIWHPEKMKWTKRGAPPPMTPVKLMRQEELARIGFGEEFYQRMATMEQEETSELKELASTHPLAVHFERIRGLSILFCGKFVAVGGDIERCPTVSSFWKGMGLDVLPQGLVTEGGKVLLPPGAVPRRIRGSVQVERKVPALPHVTRIGEQIRNQILRSGGRLKEWYDYFKEREPVDKVKMFRHKSALRLTQKLLYAGLWSEWRKAYSLPAPEPYAFAILKHADESLVTIYDFYEPGAEGRQ